MIGQARRILISLLAIFSLSAGWVSGCPCARHRSASADGSSCHGGFGDMATMPITRNNGAENGVNRIAPNVLCNCYDGSRQAATRMEAVRLAKHLVSIAVVDTTEPSAVGASISTLNSVVPTTFYRSDPFNDLAPKRGPPRA